MVAHHVRRRDREADVALLRRVRGRPAGGYLIVVALRRRVAHHERRRSTSRTAGAASRTTCWSSCSRTRRGDGTRGYTLEVRVSNDGAIRLYERHRLPADGHPARLLHRQPRGRPDHVEGRAGGAVILAIETSCDETARPSCEGRGGAVERRRLPGRAARPVRRRRARDRLAPPPGAGRARRRARRWATPARRSPTSRAIAVTAGPGPDRRAAGGRRGREGAMPTRAAKPLIPVDHLHGHVASLFIAPGAARAAVPVPARLGRPHAAARRARPRAARRCSAGASTMPPARPSTRARACSASATPAAPAHRAAGRRRRSRRPSRCPWRWPAARASTSRSPASRPPCARACWPRRRRHGLADLAASYQRAIVRSPGRRARCGRWS